MGQLVEFLKTGTTITPERELQVL